MEIGIIQYFQNQSNMFKLFMRRRLEQLLPKGQRGFFAAISLLFP
jgi:hypothetical protein